MTVHTLSLRHHMKIACPLHLPAGPVPADIQQAGNAVLAAPFRVLKPGGAFPMRLCNIVHDGCAGAVADEAAEDDD